MLASNVVRRSYLVASTLIAAGATLLIAGSPLALELSFAAPGADLAATFGWLSGGTIAMIVNFATSWWGQAALTTLLIALGLASFAATIIYIGARYGAAYLASW